MSQQPTGSISRFSPSSARRPRVTLAVWLAACGLAGGLPAPAAGSSAKVHPVAGSGDHVAPGQEKKSFSPVESAEPAPQAAVPAKKADAPVKKAGAQSSSPPGNASKNKPAKPPKPPKKKDVVPKPVTGDSPGTSATAADVSPATPATSAGSPTAAAQPASSVSATPAATPASALASPAAARRAASATARSGTLARARSSTRGRRSSRASRPATASRPAPARADALGQIPAATVKPLARSGALVARDDSPKASSPLERTVVRVLEVVPFEVRVALVALAAIGLLCAAAAVIQTIRRRRLERQRRLLVADVGVLQSALLPELPEQIGAASITAAYRPAAGLAAGGDFYDAFELPGGRTAVLIGDVAGHGREVVPLTALVRYNVRAYLEAGLPPRATLHVASNVLDPHLGDLQVTMTVAIFDPGTGRLTYASAGHAPPLLPGSLDTPVTRCASPPIGAGAPTGRRQTTIPFAPGARACFHTDGLDEAPLASGRLGREGVAEELRALGPRGTAAGLLARVARRTARQPDDMAACMITALPGGAEHWSLRVEEFEVDARALERGWADRFLLACGVGKPHIAKALRQAQGVVVRSGTAVIEVRVGEELADVRVTPPPAVMLPIMLKATPSAGASAARQACA